MARNLSNLYSIEPIFLELLKDDGEKLKSSEELYQEAYDALESTFSTLLFFSRSLFDIDRLEQFKYTVLETENTEEDVDEEEEETDNEEEEGEEGEEEEVDLFKRDRKKHLGDTSIYDPVTLSEKNVLQPGKPDLILSYDSKLYRFANEDNRSAFLLAPLKYLPINKTPTVRRVCLFERQTSSLVFFV